MKDEDKTKERLIRDLAELRKRVACLEALERDRKRVEEALRESEERFRFMAETTGDVLYRLRYNSMTYDYLSPSICKLTGYSPIEIKTLGFSNLVMGIESPGEENLSPEVISRNRLEGNIGEFMADYLIRTKSGDLKWVGDHSFPWKDEQGKLVGSVGILSDITKRKLAEDALKERNQELQRLATQDGLTHLANRRRFDEFISQEWRRMKREEAPISLILCDIDHFKLYNDSFGHQAGDACLQTIAQVLRESANRPTDLAARYGGEEFAVVLSNTSAGGAVHVAEAIRLEVQKLQISHSHNFEGGCLTLSCGVSSMIPSDEISPVPLITLADEGLYRAKRQGRNRVVLNERA